MKKLLYPILCAVLMFVSQWLSAEERLFYRYIGENGVTVISSQIPARFVPKGYDIITFDGRLIERVPPALSPEEKSLLLQQREEERRLKSWDEDLLRRYSHPDDIKAAKQRKLAQNKNDLGIILRIIEKINEDINRYQGLAAADERAGRQVSPDILNNIEALKRERQLELEKQQQKQLEKQQIIDRFDRDIERFKIIRPHTAERS